MLSDAEINEFKASLSEETQINLDLMTDLEDWPVDDDPSVAELINQISEKLQSEDMQKRFLEIEPGKLLNGVARMNSLRFARLMKFWGEQDISLISKLIKDETLDGIDDHALGLCRITMLIRMCHLLRFHIAYELFGKDRVREITYEIF